MIPQLLLEEILLGEKEESKYYDKYGKEEIQGALEALRKSNEEILNSYPADRIKKNLFSGAIKLTGEKIEESRRKRERRAFALSTNFLKLSTAAALVLTVAGSLLIRKMDFNSVTASERVKGQSRGAQIRLYRQNGNDAVLLKDGENASENDLIQITYIPGQNKYGIIFSVDGNGNITRHFPEDSWNAGELLRTGEEVPLSFSYSLDDAPDYECFVFVASAQTFDLSEIETKTRGSCNPEYLKNGSWLPAECESSVFVLNKR
ncbi:MAG: hypothetical protein J5780_04070 [Treponema sp.]|nr:hypothetical protein [Treponema sp.]